MKQFLLFLSVLFLCLPIFAQKACFIRGGFIAAVYTEPDHKIKFLNTFTNQVFISFEYNDADPQMWFAENQLVVISGKQMTVAGFQNTQKYQYAITGLPIPGTLLELVDYGNSAVIKEITTQKNIGLLTGKDSMTALAIAFCSPGKKTCIAWKKDNKEILSCYTIADSLKALWQLDFTGNKETTLALNQDGSLLAMWNGKSTTIISTATGKIEQTINENFRSIRFTVKDELICINNQNQSASLFRKTKSGPFKYASSAWFKDGKFLYSNNREEFIEWEEETVSDDLSMAIGFGSNAFALYKNGSAFLFFNEK